MRLQGLYLALATLAFASLVEFLFFTQSFALGITGPYGRTPHLFGYQFASERAFLLLVTAVFGLCAIAVVALRRSAFGRRLVALRDSEAASVTVGVNVLETKLAVFALSAGIAGLRRRVLRDGLRHAEPVAELRDARRPAHRARARRSAA